MVLCGIEVLYLYFVEVLYLYFVEALYLYFVEVLYLYFVEVLYLYFVEVLSGIEGHHIVGGDSDDRLICGVKRSIEGQSRLSRHHLNYG